MSDPTIEINMTEQATTTADNKRTHSEMVAASDATPSDVSLPDEKRIKLDPSAPVQPTNDGAAPTSTSSSSSSTTTSIPQPPSSTTTTSTTTTTTPSTTTTTPVTPKPNARAALLSRLQKQATKLETIIAEAPEPIPTPTPAPVTTTTTSTSSTSSSTNGTSPKVGKKRGRKPKSAKAPSPPPSDDEDAGRARQGRQRRPSNRFSEGGDKMDTSFQQCHKLLQVLKNHRWAWPFNSPVDPEKLGIPDYFNIIKKPMDLGSVERKLNGGEYQEIQEFADDVNLVWQNCITYNQPGSDVVRMAEELKKIFAEKWNKLKSDIESGVFNVAPQPVESAPTTPVTNDVATKAVAPKPARQPAPSRKKAPATPDARAMTRDEKMKLSNGIAQLPAVKLQRVVDIIQKRAPKASSQSTDTEIEIDLDKLDAITLRILEKYVDSTLNSKKKGSAKKSKAKKPPVPAMEGTSSATATPATSASVAGEEAKKDDSESSGGSDDESSDTDSSSDSDSSGSDSESDADSEKRKFLSAVKETDPTSAPQAMTLSSQTNNQAIIKVDNNISSHDSGAPAVDNKPLDQEQQATAGTTGDVTPTIILPAQPEAVKQEVAIENESGWAMMADSDDDEDHSKSSLSGGNVAGSAWSDFQSKNSQMKQRQKELEEKRIKDLEDKQRKVEEEAKAKELARIEHERKQEEERENAKKERERFEQSQQQKIEEDSEFDESMFNM